MLTAIKILLLEFTLANNTALNLIKIDTATTEKQNKKKNKKFNKNQEQISDIEKQK